MHEFATLFSLLAALLAAQVSAESLSSGDQSSTDVSPATSSCPVGKCERTCEGAAAIACQKSCDSKCDEATFTVPVDAEALQSLVGMLAEEEIEVLRHLINTVENEGDRASIRKLPLTSALVRSWYVGGKSDRAIADAGSPKNTCDATNSAACPAGRCPASCEGAASIACQKSCESKCDNAWCHEVRCTVQELGQRR